MTDDKRPSSSAPRSPSRVFVLGTGRCGTVTMSKACSHVTNYTVGHETNAARHGDARFDYPNHHIEIDPRLAWFLGGLRQRFPPPSAFYAHLTRNREATARSIARRWHNGRIGFARMFGESMVMRGKTDDDETRLDLSRFLVDTVIANINLFLSTVPASAHMTVRLEEATSWFPEFWSRIGADGDLNAGLAEWDVQYNPSRGTGNG